MCIANVAHYRKRVEVQAKIADAFLKRFQLEPEEIKALRGGKNATITEVGFVYDTGSI